MEILTSLARQAEYIRSIVMNFAAGNATARWVPESR